jgi:hypothetical protein
MRAVRQPRVAANLRKKHAAKALFGQNWPLKSADFSKIRVGLT